ncbi:arginase [Halomarina halobia]|uniref:Arginase n=1 Tax=Halomarina halobia TaxID=3033386 RepID=A0ABD6A5X3_9EURY|nr:arginase [Halomarina sp. PSR21]
MSRPVKIIGAPMDLGADRRGVDMGPSAIRYAGLAETIGALPRACIDVGDLPVTHPEQGDPDASPEGGRAKYLSEVESVCVGLAEEVAATLEEDAVPLILGGDHSIAIGSLNGSARTGDVGVVWFDAHGDFNTPATSPSGNVHGMPLAAVLGEGEFADAEWARAPTVAPENVALVGVRSLDDAEREALSDTDVTVFTMTDIDERGVIDVTEEALDVAGRGTDGVHVSLDLDWLDPDEAPGVGTPVRGGVTYREAHAAMEVVAECDLRSLEAVEVNPILDQHNRTAELAVELVASALGRRII